MKASYPQLYIKTPQVQFRKKHSEAIQSASIYINPFIGQRKKLKWINFKQSHIAHLSQIMSEIQELVSGPGSPFKE